MEWNETSGSLLRHQQHWVSKNVMIHLRHLLYGSENCLSKMLFSNPFPQKALRLWIWKIVIWIRSKNPQRVWILCIHDPFLDLSKKTQNPFLDSEFRIYIFPQKNAALNTGRTKCGGGGEGAFWLGFEMTLLTYVKLLTFASSMSTKLIFGSKDVVFEASCQTEGLRHLWEFFFHLQVTVVCARREQSSANRASLISWCRHFIFAFRRWKFF